MQILPFCKLRADWERRTVLEKVAEKPWFGEKQAEIMQSKLDIFCKVNYTKIAK